ncbi:MAG: MFS transporter [Treponema sp.]|jgi:PPP family 3-phenylpropionic acid transporter|nr:MFS transporter [Treponema sp.]
MRQRAWIMPHQNKRRGNFVPAYIFSFMIYGAVTPYLPLLVRDLGYSPFFVGVMLAVFEAAGMAGPFVLGYFADKWGTYRFFITATFILSVAAIFPLALFARPVISVIAVTVFAFAFRSTTPLLDAVTTIAIGKTGNYGKIRATGSISYIVLVMVLQFTTIARPVNAVNIAFWIALTSIVSIVPALLLPRTVDQGEGRRYPKSPVKKSARIWTMPFLFGFLLIFLCRLGLSPVYSFFSLYLTEALRWNAVGALNALAAASEVPFMFISARLIRRFGPLPLLAVSAAAIALRMVLYVFPFKGAIIAGQCLHSLCFGIFHPSAVMFIIGSVPPEKRALGMSLYLSLGTGLPALLGNLLGGFILETSGYTALFVSFTVPSLAALVIFAIMHKNK